MRHLIFMRHASADYSYLGPDFSRPLTQSGEEGLKAVLNFFLKEGLNIDLILHSPLKRTTQTALIAHEFYPKAFLSSEEGLSLEAHPDFVLKALQNYHFDKALLIGHAPSLNTLINFFLKTPIFLSFPNSSYATLTFIDEIKRGAGSLLKKP